MTDKELLELAAKAAGIDLVPNPFLHRKEGMLCKSGQVWNPLTDDGDALRLAVKLKLLVDVCRDTSEAGDSLRPYQCEPHSNSDPYAATRRAIVGAAAEIGKDMK